MLHQAPVILYLALFVAETAIARLGRRCWACMLKRISPSPMSATAARIASLYCMRAPISLRSTVRRLEAV